MRLRSRIAEELTSRTGAEKNGGRIPPFLALDAFLRNVTRLALDNATTVCYTIMRTETVVSVPSPTAGTGLRNASAFVFSAALAFFMDFPK